MSTSAPPERTPARPGFLRTLCFWTEGAKEARKHKKDKVVEKGRPEDEGCGEGASTEQEAGSGQAPSPGGVDEVAKSAKKTVEAVEAGGKETLEAASAAASQVMGAGPGLGAEGEEL